MSDTPVQTWAIVSPYLLKYFHEHPFIDGGISTEILDALVDAVTTSDYNTAFPNSPHGRSLAMDSLRKLARVLLEAYPDAALPAHETIDVSEGGPIPTEDMFNAH